MSVPVACVLASPIARDEWADTSYACACPCPLRVIRVDFVMSAIFPVYPDQQTFSEPVGTSHLGQGRTLGEMLSNDSSSKSEVNTHRASRLRFQLVHRGLVSHGEWLRSVRSTIRTRQLRRPMLA